MQNALQDLNILITRPTSQAQASADYFSDLGANYELMPVLGVETIAKQDAAFNAAEQLIKHLTDYQQVIFISVNAVNAALQALAFCGLKADALNMKCWAIGGATQQALAEYGVEADVAKGSSDSETLLAREEMMAVDGQKILIFRGQGGRKHLAQVLSSRGAQVDYCEVYRRLALRPAVGALGDYFKRLQNSSQQALVLIMSVDSLDAFEAYASSEKQLEQARQTPVLAPGDRVCAILKERGYSHIINSPSAAIASLAETLSVWNRKA